MQNIILNAHAPDMRQSKFLKGNPSIARSKTPARMQQETYWLNNKNPNRTWTTRGPSAYYRRCDILRME